MTFPLIAAVVAVLSCLLVGRSAGFLVRRMRPAQAVVLLAVASLAASLASGITLTAIAAAMVAGVSAVAADGHWSAAVIRAEIPIPAWLGAAAAALVTYLLIRASIRTVTIVLALVRADRLCRSMSGNAGGRRVVIVDDNSADAYTVAGLRGCVVISRRLLAELSVDERRVLTAHELSHLNNRHHLYLHVVDIAAAANPLLREVPAAVRLGVERWADEDAAAGLGDRRTTGRAVARVALIRSALAKKGTDVRVRDGIPPRTAVLGIGELHVVSRVQALLAPAPQQRTARLTVAVVASMTLLIVGVASLDRIHEAIESAAPYLHHH